MSSAAFTPYQSKLSTFKTKSGRKLWEDEEPYVPGSANNKSLHKSPEPKSIRGSSELQGHTIKTWLRKRVRFDKFGEPNQGQKAEVAPTAPVVKPQYLMSDQERKQDDIIAMIFAKFDCDGSGNLDLNELVDLFRQNQVNLDK